MQVMINLKLSDFFILNFHRSSLHY